GTTGGQGGAGAGRSHRPGPARLRLRRRGAARPPDGGGHPMRPLEGVRVVEMATWVFVPMAGAILAEWGADVIKVEHPQTGDPMRGLMATGQGGSQMTPASNFQLMNRGKRSIGLDVSTDEGRGVLYRLVEHADVFITNLLPPVRRKLGVDV